MLSREAEYFCRQELMSAFNIYESDHLD